MIRIPPVVMHITLIAVIVLLAACGDSDSGNDQVVIEPAGTASAVATTAPSTSAAQQATATTPDAGTVTPGATPASTGTAAPGTAFDPNRVNVTAERVATGFTEPLYTTHAGDGSGRLFVLEKVGRIKLLDGTVFLDISGRVKSPALNSYDREQGLLGLAFHPRFAQNRYFYVHYNGSDGNHVISRFQAGANGLGDAGSEKVLLRQNQPETNFNGGMITFGQDGYLYIGLGTGGTAKELQDLAQDLNSLMGKILRIDVDRGDPYGIPPDNPFVNRQGARPEVWAYGLRNPWRFSFDRANGDLFIGGPGEFKREWINYQAAGTAAGQNFGWPIIEGTLCWRTTPCEIRGFQTPIIEYNTYDGGNCVVIGGYVYRGQRAPLLRGAYIYGDFCTGKIWAATRDAAGKWVSSEVARLNTLISSFGEDEAGELYVTDIYSGAIYRLNATAR